MILHLHNIIPAPTAPRSLEVIQTTATSVTLQWQEPDPPNGVVRRYIIQYHIGDLPTTLVTFNDSVISTMVEVVGLSAFTNYMFRVSAVTVDEGPYTEITDITAEAGTKGGLVPDSYWNYCTHYSMYSI